MRRKESPYLLPAALALSLAISGWLCGPAEATLMGFSDVTGANGAVITITPPNPVVANPNDGILLAWDEVQNYQLVSDLAVDRVADPGAIFIEPDGSGGYLIKTGTYVSSHYIQWDPGSGSSSTVGATIHLDSEVFAFMTADQKLFNSDAILGLPGLDYNDFGSRGLESADSTTFSGNSVAISWTASSPGDWTRLITAFSPAAAHPELTTNGDPGNAAVVDFGLVRMGTTADADLTVANTGDFGSFLTGTVPTPGVGEFSRVDAADLGSLGQGESVQKTYRYSPADRGLDQEGIGDVLTEDTPDDDEAVTLTGRGVGPWAAAGIPGQEIVGRDQTVLLDVGIMNFTTDGADYGASADQTDLSVLGATHFTGQNAGLFAVSSLPGRIGEGEDDTIVVEFLGSDTDGVYDVVLVVATDENAPLGQAGLSFNIPLSVEVVPEPATVALLAFGALAVVRRRKAR